MYRDIQRVVDNDSRWSVVPGNSEEVLATVPDNTFHACATDPPYGLGKLPNAEAMLRAWLSSGYYSPGGGGFLGKQWDAFVPGPRIWKQVFRVLKPGAHALVFASTRTVDLMGLALRLAGFEIRDCCVWIYGSGMPKSVNVSLAIDKAAGVRGLPVTDDAKRWKGFGSGLKPAVEPILLARKPLDGTLVANLLKYGTGALNIQSCRVPTSEQDFEKLAAGVEAIRNRGGVRGNSWKNSSDLAGANPADPAGRWPPNLLVSHCPECDENGCVAWCPVLALAIDTEGDDGTAARYFPQFRWGEHDLPWHYCSKASKREREVGLDDFPVLTPEQLVGRASDSVGAKNGRAGAGRTGGCRNPHPTVKPVEEERWRVRLITPPGGVVLDPFLGSGSLGVAALLEGFRIVGIERLDSESEPYVRIAIARMTHVAEAQENASRSKLKLHEQVELFE